MIWPPRVRPFFPVVRLDNLATKKTLVTWRPKLQLGYLVTIKGSICDFQVTDAQLSHFRFVQSPKVLWTLRKKARSESVKTCNRVNFSKYDGITERFELYRGHYVDEGKSNVPFFYPHREFRIVYRVLSPTLRFLSCGTLSSKSTNMKNKKGINVNQSAKLSIIYPSINWSLGLIFYQSTNQSLRK